jgi:hypothetical protein
MLLPIALAWMLTSRLNDGYHTGLIMFSTFTIIYYFIINYMGRGV